MSKLFTADIEDVQIRQNFTQLIKLLKDVDSLDFLAFKWKYFTKTITKAGTIKIEHTLGVAPTDIILTRQTWVSKTAGTVAIDYVSFTKTYFEITVTGGTIDANNPLTIGGFVGRKE